MRNISTVSVGATAPIARLFEFANRVGAKQLIPFHHDPLA
jgi:hypothetical protein